MLILVFVVVIPPKKNNNALFITNMIKISALCTCFFLCNNSSVQFFFLLSAFSWLMASDTIAQSIHNALHTHINRARIRDRQWNWLKRFILLGIFFEWLHITWITWIYLCLHWHRLASHSLNLHSLNYQLLIRSLNKRLETIHIEIAVKTNINQKKQREKNENLIRKNR